MNNLRQIRQILYRLKRNFGTEIVLVKTGAETLNLETGAITPDETDFTIKRAIMLPQKTIRDFAYDLSYIAVNKNFTEGAFFEASDRFVIVDRAEYKDIDLITLNDMVEFRSQRYNIKSVNVAEHDLSCTLQIRTINGRTA